MKKIIVLGILAISYCSNGQTAALQSERLSGISIKHSDSFGLPNYNYRLEPKKVIVLSKDCYIAIGKNYGGDDYRDTICNNNSQSPEDFTSPELKEYWESHKIEVEYVSEKDEKRSTKKSTIAWYFALICLPFGIFKFLKGKMHLAKN